MELFYAMIHVMHPIHWLKLKKTLRLTLVLAYLNCDLLKNKGGLHFALYPESRGKKMPPFLKLSNIFLKNYFSKQKHLLPIFLKQNCSRSFKIFLRNGLSQWPLIKLQITVYCVITVHQSHIENIVNCSKWGF